VSSLRSSLRLTDVPTTRPTSTSLIVAITPSYTGVPAAAWTARTMLT
jgi:hypothetical protein